jgi:hypothetical protein
LNIFRFIARLCPRLVACYVAAILPAWRSWQQRRSKAGLIRHRFHAVKKKRPIRKSNRAFVRRACRG